MFLVAGLGVASAALVANYGVKVYSSWQASKGADGGAAAAEKPADAETPREEAPAEDSRASASSSSSSSSSSASSSSSSSSGSKAEGGAGTAGGEAKPASSPGFFASMFGGQQMAKRFYKGGFEDKMTRREAALILGVRESADPNRIRERHRKLLMINHPDAGGSTFVASKINEAKDVLLKGRAGN